MPLESIEKVEVQLVGSLSISTSDMMAKSRRRTDMMAKNRRRKRNVETCACVPLMTSPLTYDMPSATGWYTTGRYSTVIVPL